MSSAVDILKTPLVSLSADIADSVKPAGYGDIAISVIIPCFNSASFLRPCLESLKLQTLPQDRFEVIFVDDCSTDDTIELLQSYERDIVNLRIVRHIENRKQGAARNTGIDAACGKYLFFLDSDDFLRFDALEVLLSTIGTADVAVCQHVKTRFDKPHKRTVSNRHVKATLSLAALENSIGWWPFGMLILRKNLNDNCIRFREGVYFEDIDFNISVFLAANSCAISKEALYFYVDRDTSTVNSINEKKLRDSSAAIAHVVKIAKANVTDSDMQAFLKKSSGWLLLQAQRLRDSSNNAEEKAALARLFVNDLTERGLLDGLDAGLDQKILATANEPPVKAISGASQKDIGSFRYNPFPRDFREDFEGKVIFFCEVNYHIRSAAPIARVLKQKGIDSIIIDASRSTSFTSNRPLPDDELPLYADVDLRPFNVAETLPFSTDATAFVFMNDLTYTKRLIFENFGFGVPTFGFYEGINDDWNLDRVSPRMPYRSVDFILLPGIYQQGFYSDRACRIVGLPNVRSRISMPYVPPVKRRAIINVNFTYGVLEDRRGIYVESAVQACQELGLDYVITQHPADKADLARFNVGRESVYDMLDDGSILISRFSTTMLEALAIGRPVVYHNPIKERVPKFGNPLGAYSLSHDVESLKASLKRELDFVERGGDVRARAALFLHFHCNTAASEEPEELAASAIAEVVANPPRRFAFKTGVADFVTPPPRVLTGRAQAADRAVTMSASANTVVHRSGALGGQAQVLQLTSSDLLLAPEATLTRLADTPQLSKAVDDALAALPKEDAVAQHYWRVLAYAQGKAGAGRINKAG